MAGRPRAGFEVEQAELLAERDVVERLEVELADRRLAAADFAAVVLAADRARRDASGWES